MEDQGGGLVLSRRAFVITGTGAVAALWLPGCGPGRPRPPEHTFSARLTRREDLLRLQFDFWNLEVARSTSSGRPAQLRRPRSGADSYLVVTFAPQHLNEEAFLETSGDVQDGDGTIPEGESNTGEPLDAPPVQARVAGPSRLAFLVPEESLPLDYTTENLLAWAAFTQRVARHALGPNPGPTDVRPIEPGETQTAIEMPWHLLLSPHADSAWAHATGPVRHTSTGPGGERDVYELWHTRLAARAVDTRDSEPFADELDDRRRTVRAVWALDEEFEQHLQFDSSPSFDDTQPRLEEGIGPVFRQTVDDRDRYDIVRLSSDFGIDPGNACPVPITLPGGEVVCPPTRTYTPTPIDVHRLMLSSLGGWLDARGAWDLENSEFGGAYNTSLQEWRHRGTLGRDHFVRIVRKGFAFPFGHAATVIKVSERKFERVGTGSQSERGAYLRQRVFIVWRQPVKSYAGDDEMPHHGRKFPFRSLRCTTLVTPNLDARAPFVPGNPDIHSEVFVPEVGGQPFPFHFVGTDWAGNPVDFTCPVVFVEDPIAHALAGEVIEAYADGQNAANPEELHLRSFGGQKVAVAASDTPGDTTIKVNTVRFGAEPSTQSNGPDRPDFYPTVEQFSVELPEVQAVAGKAVGPPLVNYFDGYLDGDPGGNGFGGGNTGQVFLENLAVTPLGFDTGSSGGVVTPSFTISALSRRLGPVGGPPDKVRSADFDPVEVFGPLDAKLLGGVRLSDILGTPVSGIDRWPAIVTQELVNPRRVETVLGWSSPTFADPLKLYRPKDSGGQLELTARVVNVLADPTRSTFSIDGELRQFYVNLFGEGDGLFVRLDVRQLRFTAAKDQKPDVDVDLAQVSFHGPLHYLAELASHLAFGDGSGISIEAASDAIVASLGFNIPSVPAGVVTMKNLTFSGGITIPFDGSPVRARFAFASREDPFTLTVVAFGGSGFVAIEVGADGVELLEFALGFGGGFEVSVAVASGRVELMGGFYFSVETLADKTQKLTTTLYVDLEGEVTALGIVSVSLELHLALGYVSNPESLEGQASMTASIDVIGFGDSVTITVRKRFAGGSGAQGLMMARRSTASGAALTGAAQAVDPASLTWGDVVEEPHWAQYAAAFAPIGA
jgi:hypothetical protein